MIDISVYLQDGEKIIHEGAANKQLRAAGLNLPINKGGKLYLTDRRVIFIAHDIDIGNKFDEIPLSNIKQCLKDINVLALSPNMIQIITMTNETHQFVVTGKEEWIQAINAAANEYGSMNQNSATSQTQSQREIYKCDNCGYEVTQLFKFCPECGKEFVDSRKRCPVCNSLVGENDKFCLKCGAEINKQQIKCPQCGADIAEGVKFCPECGASTVVELKCPNCGADHAEGQKFCPECGTALN